MLLGYPTVQPHHQCRLIDRFGLAGSDNKESIHRRLSSTEDGRLYRGGPRGATKYGGLAREGDGPTRDRAARTCKKNDSDETEAYRVILGSGGRGQAQPRQPVGRVKHDVRRQ